MAHWSSTGFDQYAAESDTDGLRNAKPRWQELAELAEIYSSPSSHLSTAAAPKSNQNLGHMDRQRRQYEADRNGGWNRRLRTRDGNFESPGASRSRSWSRSRSRSRPTGPRTSMFENPATRRRGKSNQGNFSDYLSLISLLALVTINLLLSWFGVPVFANAVSMGRSTAEAVQMLYDELPIGAAKDQICRIPLVPSIMDCNQLPKAGISRSNTIRHAMPGIVFALSENPDTVDAILDLTEDINKVLIQKRQMKTPQPIQTAEPMPIEILRAKPLCIDHLLNLTSVLEANVLDWDTEKDKLLRSMYITFIRLELDSRDQTIPEFRHAIARELGAIAEVLDEEMKPKLDALTETWGLLLKNIPIKIQCLDASVDGDAPEDAARNPRQPSSLKRLLLWVLPFTNTSPLLKTSEKRLTPAELSQFLNDRGNTIGSLINGIYASSSKARHAATTAKILVQRQNSWTGRFMGLFWRRKERFDDDMMGGLREMRGLVPMLMEQRSGQRADKKYMRSMAIAKEESAKVSDESS